MLEENAEKDDNDDAAGDEGNGKEGEPEDTGGEKNIDDATGGEDDNAAVEKAGVGGGVKQ